MLFQKIRVKVESSHFTIAKLTSTSPERVTIKSYSSRAKVKLNESSGTSLETKRIAAKCKEPLYRFQKYSRPKSNKVEYNANNYSDRTITQRQNLKKTGSIITVLILEILEYE